MLHLFLIFFLGESAIHDACSRFNTSQFQAERGAFQEEVRRRLVNKYDEIACDVTDLQVHIEFRDAMFLTFSLGFPTSNFNSK